MPISTGAEFAQALAAKDFDRVAASLDPAIDFRGMTPGRTWEADDSGTVVADILERWFEPDDRIDELVSVEEGAPVSDRRHVSYRLRGHNADGPFVVEQQAYYSTSDDGHITWMRVLCSGFRPDAQ